jgi:formate hydrogenlyase subunit 3/multisubunit Na+/H+ antiporter MnhD subunit
VVLTMPDAFVLLLWLALVLYGLGTVVPLFRKPPEGGSKNQASTLQAGAEERPPLYWSVRAALWLALAASLIVFVVAGAVSAGLVGKLSLFDVTVSPPAPLEGSVTVHLALALDRVGAFFALIISGFSALVAVYSCGALRNEDFEKHQRMIAAAFNAFVFSTLWVVLAADVLSMLIALELMSLSFGCLALYKHLWFASRAESDQEGSAEHRLNKRQNAWLAPQVYLMASHVSTVFLLAAISLLVLHAKDTGFTQITTYPYKLDPWTASLVFLFALAGLGIRVGLTPAHVWVPLVHPSSPTPTHALSLGIAIKVGIYLMLRFFFQFTEPQPWWGGLLLMVAGVTALVNVWYAIASHDLKEALAYHSVENIGIIIAGLGIALIFVPGGAAPWIAALAMVASLYHLLNHAVFKGLLYMATGSIIQLTRGESALDRLGGLLRRYRWTSAAFLVGAVAISGLPPLNGFVSEWMMLQAMFQGLFQHRPAVIAVLMIALILFVGSFALTAFCFFKMVGLVLLGNPRSKVEKWKEGSTNSQRTMPLPKLMSALIALIRSFVQRVICFFRTVGLVLLGLPRSKVKKSDKRKKKSTDSPSTMLAPMGLMAALCLMLGLLPGMVTPWLLGTVNCLLLPNGREAATTGACGTNESLSIAGDWSGLLLSVSTKVSADGKSETEGQSARTPPAPAGAESEQKKTPAGGLPMLPAVVFGGVLALIGWRLAGPKPSEPVGAWNCGGPLDLDRMQYSPASLSELVRDIGPWKTSGPPKRGDTDEERGQPTEKDRTDRIILPDWYPMSRGEQNEQWVHEVFRATYNWFSTWIYDGSARFGSWLQDGDIRSYVRYVLFTQVAILLLFLIWFWLWQPA